MCVLVLLVGFLKLLLVGCFECAFFGFGSVLKQRVLRALKVGVSAKP